MNFPTIPTDAEDRVAPRWIAFWALALTVLYALLWTPHWYPLSDSALYLSMARSWADGRGLVVQGAPVDLVPPIVPVMFGAIIKAGGGIGSLHAILIALLLLSHALAFVALSQWVGQRLALAATVAGAMSYWVFYNAFTVMTEPVAMVFTWAGLWALAGAKLDRPRGWTRAALAGALFLAAALSRDAAVLVIPAACVVMWAQNRGRGLSWKVHALWMLTAALMLGGLLAYRYPAKYQIKGDRDPFLVQSQKDNDAASDPEDGEPDARPQKSGKSMRFLHGVPRDWRVITHPPTLLGRWVAESVVGPSVALFNARPFALRTVAYATGLATAVVFIVGVIWWWRRGGWWAAIPLLYLLPIWAQWGARLKPRYVAPFAPMLVLVLGAGMLAMWNWRKARSAKSQASDSAERRPLLRITAALACVITAANLPAWAVEVFIRRQSSWDFYDVARRGAAADLIDIAAHLQQHAGPQDTVWFNRGAERRVAHYLAGRKILIRDTPIQDWDDTAALTAYLDAIPATDRWAILFVDEPAPRYTWPRWHWPIKVTSTRPRFYRLMERRPDGTWRVTTVSVDRAHVRGIPQTTK